MSRYIDADELIMRVNGHGTNKYGVLHDVDIRAFINEQPTVDAVPVVHGQFVKNETGVNRHCTACGAYLEDREYENHTVRFCYYCGAKMDGERKDGME